jgi:ABC-type polysaccharide/polyol phosphate transport system ATPase subunit
MSTLTASDTSTLPKVAATDTAVTVQLEDVSVCYRIQREPIGTFKEYIIRTIQRRVAHEDFWALKNVSLSVCRGETLGIIGQNGAGKSTLLKVVSRVLRPATGRVRLQGRISPLLELGGGFHPELTGTENVFLNGTLLGHKHREISERYDQILEFAELEGFIDVPVRTYSTGMVARLGFAIASAWDPEILLVDELLTVGDTAFQRKCLKQMKDFQQNGATILLVTHDMTTALDMCTNTLWLEHGQVRAYGPTKQVVDLYQQADVG